MIVAARIVSPAGDIVLAAPILRGRAYGLGVAGQISFYLNHAHEVIAWYPKEHSLRNIAGLLGLDGASLRRAFSLSQYRWQELPAMACMAASATPGIIDPEVLGFVPSISQLEGGACGPLRRCQPLGKLIFTIEAPEQRLSPDMI